MCMCVYCPHTFTPSIYLYLSIQAGDLVMVGSNGVFEDLLNTDISARFCIYHVGEIVSLLLSPQEARKAKQETPKMCAERVVKAVMAATTAVRRRKRLVKWNTQQRGRKDTITVLAGWVIEGPTNDGEESLAASLTSDMGDDDSTPAVGHRGPIFRGGF
eukprot:Platyproteum_vivax@DN7517_c0_g1_i5.p1